MRKSRIVLLLLLALYVIWGMIVPHIAHNPADAAAAQSALGFPTAVAFFSWCKLDAAERSVMGPPLAALLTGSVAPIGVPYYYIATMKLPAALLEILKAAFYLVLLSLAYFGAQGLSAELFV